MCWCLRETLGAVLAQIHSSFNYGTSYHRAISGNSDRTGIWHLVVGFSIKSHRK